MGDGSAKVKKQATARGAEIGTSKKLEETRGFRVSMSRIREVLAQEIGMERYGDEFRAAAEEEMKGMGRAELATALEASSRYPKMTLLEIVRTVAARMPKRRSGDSDD